MMEGSKWLAIAVVGISLLIQSQFSVIEPYMDEIFHIPQAQTYCDFKFMEWDPKITTFPGLYLFSFALNLLASNVLPSSAYCQPWLLRTLSFTGALALPCTFAACRNLILASKHHTKGRSDSTRQSSR
jgi:alpha-1,2-glucosyltransferase